MSPYPLSITGVSYPIINQLETINQYANDEPGKPGNGGISSVQAGRSQTALMVVRSGGIDPATRNEIYIKRNGK
ncbi:MAG: hypothetical protein ACLUOS_09180 [Odoribacter splanchnicus]